MECLFPDALLSLKQTPTLKPSVSPSIQKSSAKLIVRCFVIPFDAMGTDIRQLIEKYNQCSARSAKNGPNRPA